MMENNNYFVNRILRKYLFPTILTILGTTLLGFANSIIVGKALGEDALAVTNIVSSFGSHVHILDWALHLDETTPHIHERHVFDARNEFTHAVGQEAPTSISRGGMPDLAAFLFCNIIIRQNI